MVRMYMVFNIYSIFIDLDVYVFNGEVDYGRGVWIDAGWKYNLLSEQWTKLQK